jgi:signal transduction histidine kinase
VCARLLEPGIDAGHCLLEVAVSDEGPGIPPEQQAMIFEPFTQMDASARRRHGGLGLGLALSRHLAALMGGQLWVESQVGVGSTFGFVARLEVARPEQPSTAP